MGGSNNRSADSRMETVFICLSSIHLLGSERIVSFLGNILIILKFQKSQLIAGFFGNRACCRRHRKINRRTVTFSYLSVHAESCIFSEKSERYAVFFNKRKGEHIIQKQETKIVKC
jgi:hypothetical protein